MYGRQATSDKITTWFHARSKYSTSPSIVVISVCRRFQSMCKHRNLNISVSSDQLLESMSEATCTMYYAKLAQKGWAGPHRQFPHPNGWNTEYERIWEEMLDTFIFTNEFWEGFWSPITSTPCDIDIPMWKQDMQSILPKYILRETEVLKSNGMILDSKILYMDENTHEPVYEEEDDREY